MSEKFDEKCIHYECGEPLFEVINNICVCPNGHCYYVRLRGYGYDHQPADGVTTQLAAGFLNLRNRVDELEAELATERDTSARERCVICGNRAAYSEIDRLKARVTELESLCDPDAWCRMLGLRDNKIADLVAELEARPTPPAPAVPPGWVAVPREPTQAMMDVAWHSASYKSPKGVWRDMIAAAEQEGRPEPPAPIRIHAIARIDGRNVGFTTTERAREWFVANRENMSSFEWVDSWAIDPAPAEKGASDAEA